MDLNHAQSDKEKLDNIMNTNRLNTVKSYSFLPLEVYEMFTTQIIAKLFVV